MDELAKMAERLGALESENKGRKDKERLSDFIGKHGKGFSDDEGIGAAILAKLDSQGIDTSAAIESAVTAILDELRTEINAISGKINKVEKAVDEAVGGDTPPSEAGIEPPTDVPPVEPPPMDAGGAPPPGDMPPPPPGAVSDARVKKIQAAFNVPSNKMKGLGALSDERFKLIEEAIDAISAIPEDAADSATVEVTSESAAPVEAPSEAPPVESTPPDTSGEEVTEASDEEDLGDDESDLDEGSIINKTLRGLKL